MEENNVRALRHRLHHSSHSIVLVLQVAASRSTVKRGLPDSQTSLLSPLQLPHQAFGSLASLDGHSVEVELGPPVGCSRRAYRRSRPDPFRDRVRLT